jgi:ectoine hydroxylase-related dioxygenase (phytanoyl-CoA dioxygenase family)
MTSAQTTSPAESALEEARPYLSALFERGYTVIKQGMSPGQVKGLLGAMRKLHEERGESTAEQPFLNRGHDVLYSLHREDVAYARAFTGDPVLMAILRELLNDVWYRQIPKDRPNFILRSLIGRSSGEGALPLHLDSFIPSSGETCFSCQVSLILEDQTAERGCTLVIPGSHRWDRYADQAAMADAIPLETQAGDIVIWDSRLWHGALGNSSGQSRWALIATFIRWWIKQNYDITGSLPQSIYDQLSDDEKTVFGYCTIPPFDEHERTDIKSGHDQLRAKVADYDRPKRPA